MSNRWEGKIMHISEFLAKNQLDRFAEELGYIEKRIRQGVTEEERARHLARLDKMKAELAAMKATQPKSQAELIARMPAKDEHKHIAARAAKVVELATTLTREAESLQAMVS